MAASVRTSHQTVQEFVFEKYSFGSHCEPFLKSLKFLSINNLLPINCIKYHILKRIINY